MGPVLFLIVINDSPYNISAECLLFADATTIYGTMKILNELNEDIFNEAIRWFEENGFSFNVDKT